MQMQYFILVLCLLLLGGSNAAKKKESKWEGEVGVEAKNKEIWIDQEEGSATGDDQTTDDEDMLNEMDDEGSGNGMDDEDGGSGKGMKGPSDDEDIFGEDDEGSADSQVTKCQQLLADVESRGLLGAYKPRCTDRGQFERVQCHGSVCWCVDNQGRDITNTQAQINEDIDCTAVVEPVRPKDRIKPIVDPGYTIDEVEPDHGHGKHAKDDEDRDDNDIYMGAVTDEPSTTDLDNAINNMPEVKESKDGDEENLMETKAERNTAQVFLGSPGILAGIIGGAVVGLLCAVLLVMFIVYRMRKKDEGSYPLDEPKKTTPSHSYQKAPTREFYA